MKHLMKLSVVTAVAALLAFVSLNTSSYAQSGVHGAGFVDENGDGYNDNAPDHDGDGIPNGQDPDYVRLNPEMGKRFGFIDEDGDGINDNIQDADGDGIPNCQDTDYVRPQDRTGNKFGQKAGQRNNQGRGFKREGFKGAGSGTGDCDGTGSKGMSRMTRTK
ncbi:hypothetical protein JXJ21_19745 [candidate division KSB1 bacterium]|nr:hypothetical protein [candidate division KSB1 bacterium]